MDVLAFTDVHGDDHALRALHDKSRHADIGICAGDLTMYGDNTDGIVEQLADFHCPVYIIHGNHDDAQTLHNLCLIHENLSFLHKQVIDVDDHHLIGYGGEGFSFETDGFESFIQHAPIPTDNIILVTHQPPYDTALDKQGTRHTGNNSFRKFIDAHTVRLSIAGHMHENFDVHDDINDTQYVNPGPKGIILSL